MSHHPPSVSVIMAAYNAEQFLPSAIESVRSQTIDDWELIVCDDGSSDRTGTIVKDYARKDRRVRLTTATANIGMSAARNLAFQCSHGNYVANMDADDLSDPQRIATQLSWARRYPRDIVCTGFTHFGEVETKDCDLYLPPELTNAALWVTTPVCSPSVMMHRNVFQALGGYTETIRHDTEDIDFLHRANRAGHQLRLIPLPLYRYRVHANSHCGKNRQRFLQRYEQFMSRQWNLYLRDAEARQALFESAISGIQSIDWPAGKSQLYRRKAAAIAVLLAIRFAQFGDRLRSRRLLLEALRLCWWRLDAVATIFLRSFGCGIQITGIPMRSMPHVFLRTKQSLHRLL